MQPIAETAAATRYDGGPSGTFDPAYNTTSSALYIQYTGISFRCSRIRMKEITRGSSNVLAAGEKYLNPQHYTDGNDGAENEGMYVGFDNDIYRSTSSPPQQDNPNTPDNGKLYGSCHDSGFNVVFCDGHVDTITYDVNLTAFQAMGNRYTDN